MPKQEIGKPATSIAYPAWAFDNSSSTYHFSPYYYTSCPVYYHSSYSPPTSPPCHHWSHPPFFFFGGHNHTSSPPKYTFSQCDYLQFQGAYILHHHQAHIQVILHHEHFSLGSRLISPCTLVCSLSAFVPLWSANQFTTC